MENDRISEAIVRFAQPVWSRETTRQIEAAYSGAVASEAKAIYDAAMGCTVDGKTASRDTALAVLADFLGAHYPWLTKEAKSCLNYAFLMVWK